MKNKPNRSRLFACIWFFLITGILAVGGATALILYTNFRLDAAIGEPSDKISLANRLQLSARLSWGMEELQTPVLIHQTPTLLEIASGSTPHQICSDLATVTDLEACDLFVDYLVYKGLDRAILAGVFSIPNGTDIISLANLITDPHAVLVRFNVLPGWRVEEIAATLSVSGVLDDPQILIDHVYQNQLEGFLYPSTYDLSRDISPQDLVQVFTTEFRQSVPGDVIAAFNDQGLSTYQAVTLASIVQREAIHEDEMPLIASVYLNRLRLPMKLDADPTVQYALGFDGASWWKSPLSLNDLQIDSPYNTYLIQGLPPTPIANPGLDALLAVAFPESSNYFFFRSACDNSGYHVFSQDFNEHLENECP